MSRRHRPSRADRKPVTRRYVARVVERARQDIVRAIVASSELPVRLEDDGAPVRTYAQAQALFDRTVARLRAGDLGAFIETATNPGSSRSD